MCGIEVVVLSQEISAEEWQQLYRLGAVLRRRGPDYQSRRSFYNGENQNCWVESSVLHLRGVSVTPQPISHEGTGDFLSWNGEIFSGFIDISDDENDGIKLFSTLQEIDNESRTVVDVFSSIHGPFAFCYWQEQSKTLWFGRDPMGRRSLLLHRSYAGGNNLQSSFMLCSSLSKEIEQIYPADEWVEVPSDHIYSISFPVSPITHEKPVFEAKGNAEDINQELCDFYFESITKHPWKLPNLCRIPAETVIIPVSEKNSKEFELAIPEMFLPYGTRVRELISTPGDHNQSQFDNATDQFIEKLSEAVRRRVTGIPPPHSLPEGVKHRGAEARLAVMFSGGIDSMLVASFATKHFPSGEPIDLLNVAFGSWPFDVPDRKTGRKGLEELKLLDPNRQWNFVEINVSKDELEQHADELFSCVFPRITVMDMTIGPALWFGARGKGIIRTHMELDVADKTAYEEYVSTSKVLLMGNGADEQMGGYGRHRTSFKHRGMEGLQLEINKDVSRIWIRNLGRDDRIISSLSKESRYPFLDFDFMSFLNQTPLGLICDYSKPPGEGDKRILRESARKIGLNASTRFEKRAIQFGSRISHLTKRKKGGHIHFEGYS